MKNIVNAIMSGRRRVTLPWHFCHALQLQTGDFIQKILVEDGVLIRRVKICDDCTDENQYGYRLEETDCDNCEEAPE